MPGWRNILLFMFEVCAMKNIMVDNVYIAVYTVYINR